MNISCCQEHVELALDIIVDEFQTAPVIHSVDEQTDQIQTCEFCKNNANYVVSDQ
ncbi:CxxH/CxxC protein [Ectobacillus ponti]|uniref:CxxH/CxxC protein n=1 Tax=Ectobacillus ponti TaxID=2961894 RepID=A0AA41XD98_9BACI|nr:CxxH/CxxC protein [Ectobacillus ponti]MCP8971239.1 CxxH/CxxC protein [Ectobacillus ponti]